jgi:hypothetical protein
LQRAVEIKIAGRIKKKDSFTIRKVEITSKRRGKETIKLATEVRPVYADLKYLRDLR